MADIERALGRPERAVELARGPEIQELSRAAQIELAIVVAGARRDLGEQDAAVLTLQIPELDPARRDPWSARLFYAYADNLLAAGRESETLQWFVHAADADEAGETDADARIAELTGEPIENDDDNIAFDIEMPDDADDAIDAADDGDATELPHDDAALADARDDAADRPQDSDVDPGNDQPAARPTNEPAEDAPPAPDDGAGTEPHDDGTGRG